MIRNKNMKHKVGDQVRIIANNTGHEFEIGSVVTIIDVPNVRSYAAIRDEIEYWFGEEECEATDTVEATSPPLQYCTTPPMTYRQWLVGKLLSNYDGSDSVENAAKWMIELVDEIIKQLWDE